VIKRRIILGRETRQGAGRAWSDNEDEVQEEILLLGPVPLRQIRRQPDQESDGESDGQKSGYSQPKSDCRSSR